LPEVRSALSHIDPQAADEPDRNCASKLIEKLAQPGNTEDIPLLARFLGLERPLDQDEKGGVSLHLRGPWYNFPAIGALSQIGETVPDALINFIKSDNQGDLKTRNAVLAMIGTSPNKPESVLSTMAKSRDSSSGQEAARIASAISFALSTPFCKARQGLCESAALK
jgi:hypothetical protein